MDAHGLDIVVGEVALGRLPLLPVEDKQVETPHDPPHLARGQHHNFGQDQNFGRDQNISPDDQDTEVNKK